MRQPFIINQQGKIGPPSAAITAAIRTPQGRLALGRSMAASIRRSLDYHSIARKALCIDRLPQGALPYYSYKEPVEAAVGKFKHDHLVIDNRGKLTAKGRYIFARRVIVPTFKIVSNPTINIADIKSRRFSLIDRYSGKPQPKPTGKFKHNVFEITNTGKLICKGDSQRRRFSVIDRAVQKARQEIMAQEDAAIFAALDVASGNNEE